VTTYHQWFYLLFDAIPHDHARRDRARALEEIGGISPNQGDYPGAQRLFEDGDALFRELDDARGSASAQTHLATLAMVQYQDTDAERRLSKCVEVTRSLGDDYLLAVNLGNLAFVVFRQGGVDRAAQLLEEVADACAGWATVSSRIKC
jgi:hypothetical protein